MNTTNDLRDRLDRYVCAVVAGYYAYYGQSIVRGRIKTVQAALAALAKAKGGSHE